MDGEEKQGLLNGGSSGSAHNHHGRAQAETDALARMDSASFSWFHVKAIVISGIGFFTDAYDLFLVSLVVPMIGFARWPELHGKVPVAADTSIKGIALVGTMLGQLIFGVLGDRLGRKAAYGVTLATMVGATLMSVITSYGPNEVMVTIFCFWRLVLGIGIGGDYPLSAVIASEFSNRSMRGAMIAAVFSMQGLGMLGAALTALVVLAIFKHPVEQCVLGEPCLALEHVWRICVALGIVPAATTYWLRKKLPETPRFTMHVKQDVELASRDVAQVMADRPGHDQDYGTALGLGGRNAAADTGSSPLLGAAAGGGGAVAGRHTEREALLPRGGSTDGALGEAEGEGGELQTTSVDGQVVVMQEGGGGEGGARGKGGGGEREGQLVAAALEEQSSLDESLPRRLSTLGAGQGRTQPQYQHSQQGQGDMGRGGAHKQQQRQQQLDLGRFTWAALWEWVRQPRNAKVLFACSAAWFLFDVAFYANTLFTPTVLQDVGFVPSGADASIYQRLTLMALGNGMVALMGGLPGCWMAVALIEVVGRKPLQVGGLAAMTLLMLLMALIKTSPIVNITLFCLTNFCANWGPNTTTFVVPGEIFPTRFRSTCHGISAASGKAGAILGVFAFGRMFAASGTSATLGALSLFAAAGALISLLLPESKGRSLEELSSTASERG